MNRARMKIRLGRDVIKSGKYYCPLCGYVMTFKTCNLDHIIPKSKGGADHVDNLQLAHAVCNAQKGNLVWPYHGVRFNPKLTIGQASGIANGHRKRKKTSRERMIDRAAANGYEDAKMIQRRMDKYYNEVNQRYREIHPLPL